MIKLLPLLLLLLFPLPSLAEVTVSTSEDNYIVQGKTRNQIARFYRHREEKFSAYARPEYKSTVAWGKQNGRCYIRHVKVHLHIQYMYPRLANSTDNRTKEWWNGILKKLAVHERVHGEIAREIAYEMEKQLMSLEDLDCHNIKQAVQNKIDEVLKLHKKRQEAYDRLTEHGLKQERYKDH